jgi:hypothetical protein
MKRRALIVGLAVLFGGCGSRRESDCWRADSASEGEPHAMRIELLGFATCPNTPAIRDNLREALKLVGGGWAFTEVNQEALPESDVRRGWPAPTVLVNGADLFGMAPPSVSAMGCRMYADGVPSAESIAERLRTVGK